MTVSCEKVGLDYFDVAPVRFTASEVIAATPYDVFAVFLDADSWTKWVFAITGVEWTSPFPLEVGSTRTVHMRGGMTGYEEFVAWDQGRRMAFRFARDVLLVGRGPAPTRPAARRALRDEAPSCRSASASTSVSVPTWPACRCGSSSRNSSAPSTTSS